MIDNLLQRFGNKVKGVIQGFDRIVFKGTIRPIVYAKGMQLFLKTNNILNKNYKEWVTSHSKNIIEIASQYSVKECGKEIIYIPSCNTRKEELAHEQQKKLGITEGLVGVWSCVESCNTFQAQYDGKAGYPQLHHKNSRCKHLYFYFDHKEYGFMSVRLQTWAPYNIQIALNGREWLKRLLDKEKCDYLLTGNKFLHIEDYQLAQKLLDNQLTTDWSKLLSKFANTVFSKMPLILGENLSYYWTLWQSKRARDYIFEDTQTLSSYMHDLLLYAFVTGTSERVLRYMGKPVSEKGQPHPSSKPKLYTQINNWHDGARIRHNLDKNSLKIYNEQNVLRLEMTMNAPEKFHVYRHAQGQDSSTQKKLMPMRKGIADINLRAKVSDDKLNNFSVHLASFKSKTPVEEVLSGFVKAFKSNGKRVRGLDIFGKDKLLLQAISDPIFDVNCITNKKLQEKLRLSDWSKDLSGKQLSSRISRHLKLLREHGIIKKLPNQRKYSLTEKGKNLTSVLNLTLAASTSDLLNLAA